MNIRIGFRVVFAKNCPISIKLFLLVLKTVWMKIILHCVEWVLKGVIKYLTRRIKEFAVKEKQFFYKLEIASYLIQVFEKFPKFI